MLCDKLNELSQFNFTFTFHYKSLYTYTLKVKTNIILNENCLSILFCKKNLITFVYILIIFFLAKTIGNIFNSLFPFE